MPKIRLYHNPRCSKSRQALALLQERGVEPEIVRYLETPPDAAELDRLFKALRLEPPAALRFSEARAKELGLTRNDDRPRAEWLALLAANPVLLERPIAVAGAKASLGRPPETVLDLLEP